MTFGEIEQLVTSLDQQRYLAKYIFSFIHVKNICEISQISPLSKAFRNRLTEDGFHISHLATADVLKDPDGTVKYIFNLPDGGRIETVLLSDGERKTLCVSTQAGCAMGCAFCATAKIRFNRNLTAAEIADQVNIVQEDGGRISNVVYMGMGEPLANYDSVLRSVRILNHPEGKNIGIRHITVSTAGLPDGIGRLADEDIYPRLAISLNAPTDAIRNKLMPINSKYPIAKLLAAVDLYCRKTANRVTFEYVLIKGVNDTVLHAKLLAKLLRGRMCNVNLIEFNPHEGCSFTAAGMEAIKRCASVLNTAGIETTVRAKMGRSIKAACGQLGSGGG